MYGVWNLVAGTYGFFFPYILDAVGSTPDRAGYALQAIWFARHLPHGADQRAAVRDVQRAGFTTLAVVLALMLIVSGLVGIAFAPTPEERDIERTDRFRRDEVIQPSRAA